eukprot:7008311-Pyramimonas_sp.AAC.1
MHLPPILRTCAPAVSKTRGNAKHFRKNERLSLLREPSPSPLPGTWTGWWQSTPQVAKSGCSRCRHGSRWARRRPPSSTPSPSGSSRVSDAHRRGRATLSSRFRR